jgi:ABC-type phosphate transport system substrate-binding protein
MFNSYRAGTTAAVGLLTAIALAFAASAYSNRSSDAAWDEFMSATSASDQDRAAGSSTVQQGSTGCPVGKRKLPTQLKPLP